MEPEALFRIAFFTLSAAVLTMVVAGVVLWGRWLIAKFHRGTTVGIRNLCGDLNPELITELPKPFPRWSMFDFFLMFGLMILAGSLLQPVGTAPVAIDDIESIAMETQSNETSEEDPVTKDPTADEQLSEGSPESTSSLNVRVQIHFAANAIALVLTLLYLNFVHRASPRHLTIFPTGDDVRRGLVATVWILAPVLVINIVASQLVQYEHTVTDLLAQKYSIATFAFLFLSAAILTPIVEEFQFRLLLQGGLQKLTDPIAEDDVPSWHPRSAIPVVLTSLLFATMHLGQGAAPIPLFFLSLGLGFLYQRTGRLVPVIVVHMMLNSATLCVEFCRIGAGVVV